MCIYTYIGSSNICLLSRQPKVVFGKSEFVPRVQMRWIFKPKKSRSRWQGSCGGVGKSAPRVHKSSGVSEWLKVASTQKKWLIACLRHGKDPENFATCIAHHGALALHDTSVIVATSRPQIDLRNKGKLMVCVNRPQIRSFSGLLWSRFAVALGGLFRGRFGVA